jgi:hypothetical protein
MNTRILPVILSLVLVLGLDAYAQNDSLQANLSVSASMWNPTNSTWFGDDGLERDTKFNFRLISGIDGSYGSWHFTVNETYVRLDGPTNLTQNYLGRYKHRYFEIGTQLTDDKSTSLELLKVYVEGIVKQWAGIGITRKYDEYSYTDSSGIDIHGGAWLGRISLAKERHSFMGVNLTVRSRFEFNPSQYVIYTYVDVRNLRSGRFSLVPFIEWGRVYEKAISGSPAKDGIPEKKRIPSSTIDAYQVKIKLVIQV